MDSIGLKKPSFPVQTEILFAPQCLVIAVISPRPSVRAEGGATPTPAGAVLGAVRLDVWAPFPSPGGKARAVAEATGPRLANRSQRFPGPSSTAVEMRPPLQLPQLFQICCELCGVIYFFLLSAGMKSERRSHISIKFLRDEECVLMAGAK